MRSIVTIVAVLMLSFAVTAFADDFAVLTGPDTGAIIYEASLSKMPVGHEAQFTLDKPVSDVGIMLYESFLAERAEAGKGVAAGGRGGAPVVDENTRIWDALVAPKLGDITE